ncbi:hypothetical protein AUJ14_02725 [Candidatus Micrarchaeota archaeon CG1_02_55_22]|nr:MAG: hypothetical protein AUJ14_02725 [Candidatus Micrarchaeota archaeon CG1_02_55_22]
MERLNARKLAEKRFGKSIHDASWSEFVRMINYKAVDAGCVTVLVEPRGTTRSCSNCGFEQKMPLSQRTFACDGCGLVLDRDVNAARNILDRATGRNTAGYAEINAFGNGTIVPSMKEEAHTVQSI